MVSWWGMSDRLGPVAFRQADSQPFLGQELAEPREYSERTAQVIDEEVARMVADMEDKAVGLLADHRKQLDRLAETLLTEETLDREAVLAAVDINGGRG
jgi:cell division protease FtsH